MRIDEVFDEWFHVSRDAAAAGQVHTHRVENITITSKGELRIGEYKGEKLCRIEFVSCKFDGSVDLRGFNALDMVFNDCTWTKNMTLAHCTIDELSFNGIPHIGQVLKFVKAQIGDLSFNQPCHLAGLQFELGCTVQQLTIDRGCIIRRPQAAHAPFIISGSTVKDLFVTELELLRSDPPKNRDLGLQIIAHSTCDRVHLKQMKAAEVMIGSSSVIGSFTSDECTIDRYELKELSAVSTWQLSKPASCTIAVHKSSVSSDMQILGGVLKEVTFKNSEIYRVYFDGIADTRVLVDGARVTKELFFNDCSVSDLFVYRSADVQLIEARDALEVGNFRTNDAHVHNVRLIEVQAQAKAKKKGVHIKNFHIKNAPLPSGVVSGAIDELYFEDLVSIGHTLSFNDLRLKQFKVDRFFNLGDVSFSNVEYQPGGGMIMENSDLGRMNLIRTDLSRAAHVEYEETMMSLVRFMNTEIPSKVLRPKGVEPGTAAWRQLNKEDRRKAAEHWYRQTKLAYTNLAQSLKHSDQLGRAREYTAKALYEHYNWLHWVENKTLKTRADRIALWLNGFSNGHGFDLGKATIAVLVVPICFYLYYCMAFGLMPWAIEWRRDGIDFLKHYFEFAYTPLRPLEVDNSLIAMSGEVQPIGAFPRAIDIISRIVSSYLIYQFVQAFRHYGRIV
jgi:hypothetical protein